MDCCCSPTLLPANLGINALVTWKNTWDETKVEGGESHAKSSLDCTMSTAPIVSTVDLRRRLLVRFKPWRYLQVLDLSRRALRFSSRSFGHDASSVRCSLSAFVYCSSTPRRTCSLSALFAFPPLTDLGWCPRSPVLLALRCQVYQVSPFESEFRRDAL